MNLLNHIIPIENLCKIINEYNEYKSKFICELIKKTDVLLKITNSWYFYSEKYIKHTDEDSMYIFWYPGTVLAKKAGCRVGYYLGIHDEWRIYLKYI